MSLTQKSQVLLEILLKISSCKRFVAGGALKSHFLFYLQIRNRNVCAELFVFSFTVDRNHPSSNPVLDTMRHKLRRDQREVRIQIAAEQKWDARQELPAAESCQNRQQKKKKNCFWRNESQMFQVSPEERCEKLLASKSPVCALDRGRRTNHRTRKLKKRQRGAIGHSQIDPPCIRGRKMHILCCLSSLNMPQLLMQGQAG